MEAGRKKRVLIIVRGAKPAPHFKNNGIEKVRNFIFSGFTSKKGIINESYDKIVNLFKDSYDKVEQLGWDGDIIKNPSLSIPIAKLNKLLEQNKNCNIDIIAVSLGGHILEKALKNRTFNKIDRVMYIGAIHNVRHKIRGINKVINVYSEKDKMFFIANDIIEGIGNFILQGKNVINVALKDISHDMLLRNKRLNQKDLHEKYLHNLYLNLLVGGK